MGYPKTFLTSKFQIFNGLIIGLVLLVVLCKGSHDCPNVQNCQCIGQVVNCRNIESELPTELPKDTTKMTFINLNLSSLPLDFFTEFKNLMQLYIKNANINVIKSCTFQGLNLQGFTLREAVIGEIESYAFSNVHDLSVFSFYKNRIEKIQDYAFYNFHNITRFDLQKVVVSSELPTHTFFSFHNIGNMEIRDSTFAGIDSLAWNELSGYKLNVYNNTFTTISCQRNESLAVIFDQVEISLNKVLCSCELSWLIGIPKDQTLSMLKYLNLVVDGTSVKNNICSGPQELSNYTLGRLTFELLNCPQPELKYCPSLRNLEINPPFSICRGVGPNLFDKKRVEVPPTDFKEWENNNTSCNRMSIFILIILILLSIFEKISTP